MTGIERTAIAWLETMRAADRWDLTVAEMCALLSVKERQYKSWLELAEEETDFEFNEDTQMRASLLVGIHKALLLTSPTGHEYAFFNRSNKTPPFDGRSAKELLLDDPSIETFFRVRNYFGSRM